MMHTMKAMALRAWSSNQPLELTATEFKLLTLLAQRAGRGGPRYAEGGHQLRFAGQAIIQAEAAGGNFGA